MADRYHAGSASDAGECVALLWRRVAAMSRRVVSAGHHELVLGLDAGDFLAPVAGGGER